MTGSTTPDPFRDWDGAYVMGMLSPDERRAFERHVVGCAECAKAVGELAGLPGILGVLSADDATALLQESPRSAADAHLRDTEHRPELVQSLARSVKRRRSRMRRAMAGIVLGVGVVLAVAGVLTGAAVVGAGSGTSQLADGTDIGPVGTSDPTDAPSTPPAEGTGSGEIVRAMAQVEPGWLDADLVVTEKGWGTRFDWDCSYRERAAGSGYGEGPTTYDLVVTDAAGSETTVASWTASGGGAAGNLSASTSIATTDIRSVDIRVTGTDRPLVRTSL